MLFAVTFVFGTVVNGAKNWIFIGPISVQPSELVKVVFIFAGASTLDRLQTHQNLIEFIAFAAVCKCVIRDKAQRQKAGASRRAKLLRKDHQRSASVLLHEMGHAIDARLGQRRGAKLISYSRLEKYGNRTLAEIVRDDMITPIYEAAKAERPEMFSELLKGIPKSTREELSRVMADSSTFRWDWLNIVRKGHEDDRIRALNIALLNTGAPREIFDAIAKGNDKVVLEFLLEKTETMMTRSSLLEIDKYSKSFRELLAVVKEADDEEAIFGGISDMFEAATGHAGAFGGWGHGERYWRKDKVQASTEAFAEILEILGSPSKKKNYILDKYLPTARDFVLDAIKEAEL